MTNLRFLVISLGNPAPYHDTFHSAGHHALTSLQRLLGPTQPPFSKVRLGKKAALTSSGPKYTLAQSPTLMNVSGPWALSAYRDLLAREGVSARDIPLVVVHDELEAGLGVIKRREWGRSHRGHNGVKSVGASFKADEFPGAMWARVAVGIGRPEERDARKVADYVLSPMSQFQRDVVGEKGAAGVLKCLEDMEREWLANNGSL